VFPDKYASYLGEVPDGILGMALGGVSEFHAKAFFQTLVDEGQLLEPVFGLSLAESNPVVVLGGRDKSRFKGDLTCVIVKSDVKVSDTPVRISRGFRCLHYNMDTIQTFWQTKLDEIAVNGKNIALPVANKSVIIETINNQIWGFPEAIVEFYKNVPGSAPIESSDGQYKCTLSLR
jgi:hypothetical protein